ncbi:MAG: MFS transporter [Dehalococcoidia bacterium]
MSATRILGSQRDRLRGVYRGWWIVLVAYYTQLISAGAGGWVFGVLILSMQEDLGWSQTTVVGVLVANRWIGGLLSVPLGPVVDRYGSRVLMTASAVLAGVALIGVAFSSSVFMFYAAWALYGVAHPGVAMLGPRVAIANWFIRKRAQAFVLFTLGSATAGIAAAPAAGWIDVQYGWRLVWLILGCMSFTVAPLAWWAVRRRPEDVGLLPDGDRPQAADGSGAAAKPPAYEAPWTVRQALRTRAFWLVTAGFLLVAMPSSAIFINISGFVQSHGFSRELGATVVSAYGFGVLLGRPVWGVFLARIGLHRTMVAFAVIYAVSIAVFAFQTGLVGIFITVLWLGIAIAGSQLMNAQAMPDYFGRRIVGTLTGYSQLANVAVGGSAPLITAAVFDATGGYVPAFLFFAAACGVAGLSFFFAPPPVHPDERDGGGGTTPAEDTPARAAV